MNNSNTGFRRAALALAVSATLAHAVQAQDSDLQAKQRASVVEEVFIFADTDEVRSLPGSAALVSQEQFQIEFANDINQLLKTVPGTYIREEDGYGLRPNIGIRGATSERSSKITLMEDGVMIAPAPYSNPAAYYFPTAMRMHSVEVLKGAPLLRYGPQTTGGVVNMVSTPIPETLSGNLDLRAGQNGEQDLLANIGGQYGQFGFLLETAQRRSDGFKEIDRGNDSGYDIEDYLVKLAWTGERQSVLFKAQYSNEISDETYLGLTDADFANNEDRRYGLSSLDEMNNYHAGVSLRYGLQVSDDLSLTVTAYQNNFSRDWFKLGGGNSFVNAANTGDAAAQAILEGTADAFGLGYKHNNRDYESRGIELNLDHRIGDHSLSYGMRVHEDEMDRYQPVDVYDQINGQLLLSGRIEPVGGDNRLEDAEALSAWIVDSWQLTSALNLNLALRYEDVDSSRRQFSDPDRETDPSRRSNNSSEWLPGASFTYELSDKWQALAGVHRGFSPLGGGAQDFEEAETSINWEAGVRYTGSWYLEAIAFYSDFDNKTENCSNANPCSNGATAGAFTTGQAVIQGLELQASTVLSFGDMSAPIDLAYTYTDAQISRDNVEEGFVDGDTLAAVPENTLSLRLGLETAMNWDNYAVIKYIDETCVTIGCNNDSNPFNRTEDLLVTDLISRYALSDDAVVFFKFENVFDERAIVSRQPEGARPNKPRTASVGLQYQF
ncbi:TonB-dependent receptor [Congregibacter variabilis]|uniref:TonB-dependent receptor n=1 Tax=Congregibacter variabilis TaxID=3081200 RepID=A0ABZ0HZ42_9GAMM|nr:TonB-dependent receptor [Congregibacter sp. IMCC43200]